MVRAMATTITGRGLHWAQINEYSCVAGMRLLYWLARLFGRWPFRLVLYPVLVWYLLARPVTRAASGQYLRRAAAAGASAIGKPNSVSVLRHFAAFGETILDKMLLWSGLFNPAGVKHVEADSFREHIAARRGGLIVCCHIGNFDLCRVLGNQIAGLKITVLIHTRHAERFSRMMAQINPASALNLIQVTELSPATAILLAQRVAEGEFIVIAGDRIPVSPRPRVAYARFLGAWAPFPVGPYILASVLQCPVFLIFGLRIGQSWEIHLEKFRDAIALPRPQRERLLAELAGDYALRLEYYCRRAPFQWFNFYDFWQMASVPAGALENVPPREAL
jgi:predicted LPLAT superfamily acyltransferase